MAALGPLMGEQLGLERCRWSSRPRTGGTASRLGDAGEVEVEDIVPWGAENGEPARSWRLPSPRPRAHAREGGRSRLSVFGLEPDLAGKSGFSQPFSWSA